MLKRLKWIIYTKPFGLFVYLFIKLYLLTVRVHIINLAPVISLLENGEKVLLCGWHQQFFSAIGYFKKFSRYSPIIMISRSRDGDLISRVANLSGWKTARGSSSRGGRTAMEEVIQHLKKHSMAAHILDGPQGPMGRVKAGAVRMARETGASIVTIHVEPRAARYFRSWDQFMLPLPFSSVRLCFGTPFKLEKSGTPAEFEQQRMLLENSFADKLVVKYPLRR